MSKETSDNRSTFMLRLPFALCKERGIILPEGATPSVAWRALEPYNLNPRTESERIAGREWKRKQSTKKREVDRARSLQALMPDHSPDMAIRIVEGEIAGVKAGPPMTFEEADSGSVNPYYETEGLYGYDYNCQACVVTFEARMRGFDVRALPDNGNRYITKLSGNTLLAWRKPGSITVHNVASFEEISELIAEGQRFNLRWFYKVNDSGHIISLLRINGELIFYDAQSNTRYSTTDFKQKVMPHIYGIQLYRIDNLGFNYCDITYIMKGVKNG